MFIARGAGKIHRVLVFMALTLLAPACTTITPGERLPAVHVLADAGDSPLGALTKQAVAKAPAGLSGFRLLPDAGFSWQARRELAQRAQRSLDVQYYLFRADAVGMQLLRDLRDAAARGVRVRVILDDLNIDDDDDVWLAFSRLPRVEVRLFNPLAARKGSVVSRVLRSLPDAFRINHRMHNKLLIADDSMSVSGGRNIAEDYFMRGQDANFIDLDILSVGAIVHEQSKSFDTYWNSAQVIPVRSVLPHHWPSRDRSDGSEFLARSVEPEQVPEAVLDPLGRGRIFAGPDQPPSDLIWAKAEVYSDDPAKLTRGSRAERVGGSVTDRAIQAIRAAQTSVEIVSPYFVPGERGIAILQELGARGVKATLLTNSLGATDEPLAHAGYVRYRRAMLLLGVRIFEMGATLTKQLKKLGDFKGSHGRLHAKVFVIDDDRLFVGSMNMDGRSASLNTESGLMLQGHELVNDFRRLTDGDRFRGAYEVRLNAVNSMEWVNREEGGQERILEQEPGATIWTPLKRWLVEPLVPEEIL